MTYEQLGGKLTERHPQMMVNVERRMCRCRVDAPTNVIRGSYPPCVYKMFRDHILLTSEEIENILLERFWELEIKEVQKKNPALVMEIYMMG